MNGSTIYHLTFIQDGSNHYFGSITAIFDRFTNEQLGVSKTSLWTYGITEERPYKNKKCIIRKGIIYRTKTLRNNPLLEK